MFAIESHSHLSLLSALLLRLILKNKRGGGLAALATHLQ